VTKRIALLGLILLLGVVLAWVVLVWEPESSGPGSGALEIASAPQGGDFVLFSSAGAVDLKQMRGKVVVLFFGYTMCPDVCPTSLSLLSAALNGLAEDFVSVDPTRDSQQRLQEYTAYFHPNILGVTGTAEQVAVVAGLYGAAFRAGEQNSKMGYLVDHSADLYVVDQQGRLYRTLRHGTPPREVLAVLKELLGKPQI